MKKYYLFSVLVFITFFGLILFTNIVSAENSEIQVVPPLNEPLEEVGIVINSPLDNSTENNSNNNQIYLDFTVTGSPIPSTHCWYDFGGNDKFDLPNCQSKRIDLPTKYESGEKYSDKDFYVLNVFISNDPENFKTNKNADFSSVWFKIERTDLIVKLETSTVSNDRPITYKTNDVPLNFSINGNPTKCWYDLGGLKIKENGTIEKDEKGHDLIGDPNIEEYKYIVDNCQIKIITLPEHDYVLNFHVIDDKGNHDFDSVWFKIETPIRKSNKSSGSIPSRFISKPIENGRVLGAEKFNFTLPLKFNSQGNEVTELQKKLILDGYLKITIPTDYFGPLTFKAVKDYQLANGLKKDGTVGPLTRALLNK